MSVHGPLAEDERSVLLVRPHWKTILRPMAIGVITVAAAIFIVVVIPSGSASGWESLAVLVIALIILLAWVLVPILRWRMTTYELTTQRLRLREGVLSRKGRDFPLARISDVSFQHGPIDRLLGCGTLIVESAGEHGQLVFSAIPNVEQVQATLFQLVQDEQQGVADDDRGPNRPPPSSRR
jgi:uncharacterized membrane protein YdbT with pleckstrin-like domain